jgi:phosphotransferase system HPr (HPr) family protein
LIEIRVIVLDETGLHARPAAQFVKAANGFTSEIWIRKDDKKVNAKSIVGVLSLGASQGTEIVIGAQGEDEIEAVQELEKLIKGNKA